MQKFTEAGIKPGNVGVVRHAEHINRRQMTRNAGLATLALLAISVGSAALADDNNPLADKVRAADARFSDVAVAKSEGYAPIPCVSGPDGGAMGIHYVNQKLIDDPAVDVAHPEAILYEPGANGALTLVAVEYITPKGPAALGGQLFTFTNAPNRYGLPPFYSLHLWAWRDNPMGAFADMNPNVSCAAVMGDGM